MADVTISQLSPGGVPPGFIQIPGSDGSATNKYGVGDIHAYAKIYRSTYSYGGGGYGVTQVGVKDSASGTVALCEDVASVAGGNFNGTNQVIIPANGILAVNAARTNFVGVARIDSNNKLLIGPDIGGAGLPQGPVTIDASGNIVTPASIDAKNVNPIALIKGTDQVVTNSASYPDTKAVLNNPIYDRYSKWNTSTNRYTFPSNAIYSINMNFRAFIRNAGQYFKIYIYKNNASVVSDRYFYSATGDGHISGSISYADNFTTSDFIEIYVKSNSYYGGSYSYTCAWGQSVLTINRV